MMLNVKLKLPLEQIQAYCQNQAIQRLSLFGSVLRDDFSSDSDIDVLIEFLPTAKITYFELYKIQENLQDILGYKVDVLTPNALSDYFREDVLNHAQVIYERKP